MKIYVIGNIHQAEEIKKKISDKYSIILINSLDEVAQETTAVIFDFAFDDSPDDLEQYTELPNLHLFVNATRISLAELLLLADTNLPNIYGFAGDPTFLERSVIEVTAHHNNLNDAEELFSDLKLNATLVDDRVGMVTPRIIAMIINEAFYTVMEGTATRKDVDTAMKLGTNYPMGPFEWADAWGIAPVYELLEALHLDTKDERYKICPLLKQEYLRVAYS